MRYLGTRASDESGFGLLASLLVLMIVAVLGTTLVSVTMTDLAISSNLQARTAAFYAADSGVQQTIVDLAVDGGWTASLFAGGVPLSSPSTITINGNTVTAPTDQKTGQIVPGYYPLGSAISIGGATYRREVFMPLPAPEVQGPHVWLTFPVRVSGEKGVDDPASSVIGVDVRVRVQPGGGPWSYALAAGDGWGQEAVEDEQGSLRVHGSMRIFGDKAQPAQLRWHGSAAVLNHYEGLGDTSRFGAEATRLPTLDTVVLNGETVETLHAIVNVENADFDLQSNASWGEADASGNTYKEMLDGVYIDGNLTVGGSAGAYSEDSGRFQDDDLDFPKLTDPYTDPSTGTSYASHQAFLDAVSLSFPYERISESTPAFDLSDGGTNRISWDPATGTLSVEGIIKRTGDLELEFTGNADNTIIYTGKGTIYASEDLHIRADLLPFGDYLGRDNLGLIAGDSLNFGLKGNQDVPRVMAAAYGGVEAQFESGGHIAGSLVGGHVTFNGSAGTIAQVPKLALVPPPGMPGSGGGSSTIIEILIRDWHEER